MAHEADEEIGRALEELICYLLAVFDGGRSDLLRCDKGLQVLVHTETAILLADAKRLDRRVPEPLADLSAPGMSMLVEQLALYEMFFMHFLPMMDSYGVPRSKIEESKAVFPEDNAEKIDKLSSGKLILVPATPRIEDIFIAGRSVEVVDGIKSCQVRRDLRMIILRAEPVSVQRWIRHYATFGPIPNEGLYGVLLLTLMAGRLPEPEEN